MAGNLLRLLVIFLSISRLICLSNAVPLTRLGRQMHRQEPDHVVSVPENNPLQVDEEKSWEKHVNVGGGRVAMELNDYPGSGANNRHTPRP